MKAVILCGGKATRLSPLTDKLPKSLIEVAGKPFIFHQLDLLREANLHRILLCVGYMGDKIQDAVGSHYRGMVIDYIFDGKKAIGTAGALRQALPLLGNAFYVIYGDSYLDCDYDAISDSFFDQGMPALITAVRNTNRRYTNNVLMQKGKLLVYDKRHPLSFYEHIDYGLSILSPAALLDYDSANLEDVYHDWSLRDRLAVYEVNEPFYEIGSFEGLEETRKHLEGKR